MGVEYEWLLNSAGPAGDAPAFLDLAKRLEGEGKLHLAATAYDRAFGLNPASPEIQSARQALLERLAITEHGIVFRYIPAGSFLMGSDVGDPDEKPVHAVRLKHYWISQTPISWAAFADLMGWEPPPYSFPPSDGSHFHGKGRVTEQAGFYLLQENKIRAQYCEDVTTGARDSGVVSSGVLFGEPEREDPRRPSRFDRKPMVSVSWQEAEEMCALISDPSILYRLPTEAEWEKAARGGLVGCLYPWGNELPSEDRCDFDRFHQFSILPMRRFPPNGYGLYGVSGCIWEWVADWYDARYYTDSEQVNPTGPATGRAKVLRGGSWADCAEVVTVSFRISRVGGHWRDESWGGHCTPNVGFRIARFEQLRAAHPALANERND